MEIVNASRNNLASVLMGKNIQFPWRGQNNVIIIIPYTEWLCFVREHKTLLQHRNPLNYEKMLKSDNEDVCIRYFMYESSWALYSELACSSNVGKDATLILPHFDSGKVTSIGDVVSEYIALGSEQVNHCHNSLKAATRLYYGMSGDVDTEFGLVDLSNLSEWNTLIYKICIYLQSRSSNKVATEKINIDWRLS